MSIIDLSNYEKETENINNKEMNNFRIYDINDIEGITLMHKNDPVLYFTDTHDINVINKNLLPYQLKGIKNLTLTTLLDFIRFRSVSIRRKYYKDIVNYLGIQQEASEYAIILKTQALSLQDHYWIKIPSNPYQTWEEVNLFENKFSEAISFIAFTGSYPTIQNEMRTPEVATGGIYPKCWRRLENEIFLFKSSLEKGIEAECEVFSSKVASLISDNVLNYDFTIYENRRSSKCKLFTSISEEEVSATTISKFLARKGIPLENFLLNKARDYYYEILLIDSIVNNGDRHNSNFSFLSFDDFKLKPAPIFDFNNTMNQEDKKSLIDFKQRNNLEVLHELIKRKPVEEKVLNLRKAIDDGRLDILNKDLIKYDSKLYNELKARLSWRLDSVLNKKDDMIW